MRRARSRSLATSRRLYFAVALGLVVAATALAGCGGASAGGQKQPGASSKPVGRIAEAHVEATIPGGWNVIHRPITGVLYPRQVLAAASFPVTFPHSPRGCRPSNVLSQMPADGALLQLIEYTPRDSVGKPVQVPQLPPRPSRFLYKDAAYGRFECAGLSYKFDFEQGGRAFQAQVWFNRKTVAPRLRAEALQILDSLRPTGHR